MGERKDSWERRVGKCMGWGKGKISALDRGQLAGGKERKESEGIIGRAGKMRSVNTEERKQRMGKVSTGGREKKGNGTE